MTCCFLLQLTVLKYNDEEWEDVLVRDADWSREETDYLLDLCQRLDLRFMAIADRYEVRSDNGSQGLPFQTGVRCALTLWVGELGLM